MCQSVSVSDCQCVWLSECLSVWVYECMRDWASLSHCLWECQCVWVSECQCLPVFTDQIINLLIFWMIISSVLTCQTPNDQLVIMSVQTTDHITGSSHLHWPEIKTQLDWTRQTGRSRLRSLQMIGIVQTVLSYLVQAVPTYQQTCVQWRPPWTRNS